MLLQKAGEHIAMKPQTGRGRGMAKKERGHHINISEVMLVKITILNFTKNLSNLTIHIQMGNKVALSFLLKMGWEVGGVVEGIHSLFVQDNLALSAVSWDHNYCRIFTKQIECLSRDPKTGNCFKACFRL